MKGVSRQIVIWLFPTCLVDGFRSFRSLWRRNKFKLVKQIDRRVVTGTDLVKAFRALGLKTGDKLMLYSSMSKFGFIEGGPKAVINAIEEVIGPEGLIAMPAFPIIGNAIEYLKRGIVFDVRKTRSNMGALTEYFRHLIGVQRSIHPTHSICAKGKGALELVKGHENCETAFGLRSPFSKMIDENIYLVSFGVGVHVFTLYHTFEDFCGNRFPFRVYLEEPVRLLCTDEEGNQITVETRIHDPLVSRRRIDANPMKENEIHRLLFQTGKLKSSSTGRGEILAIKAKDLMEELEKMLEMGVTIYL